MRIGFIDADLMDNGTRHPNLALMKMAGYYRDQGHEVSLIYDDYRSVEGFDRVFISKVFTFTKVPGWVLELEHVSYGGTGFYEDGGPNLPDEIEHHMPYYDLYLEYVRKQLEAGRQRTHYADYLDYSIGFTSRGCFRKCSFCVNKKYSHAFLHSPVEEFMDETRPYIYLWDDNILALPQWESVIDALEAAQKPFQFRQGIDIRLLTDKKAKRLVASRYHGDFIFAFDHLEDKALIVEKIQLWKRYSSKVCKLYVLSGYKAQDETDIEDVFERIHTLMRYGSLPYIMRYEAYKESRFRSLYVELARWCNQPNFFKKKSFREFCTANQEYKKNKATNCSAYQAMLDFEREFPEIAARYFDLRFDRENLYSTQYGYGRKYANKPLCRECKRRGICWAGFLDGSAGVEETLQAYFTKELDLECLRYGNSECGVSQTEAAAKLCRAILDTDVEDLVALLADCEQREGVTKENVPQLSLPPEQAALETAEILCRVRERVTFEDLGHYLTVNDPERKQNLIANKKYGENHGKFAALLDLAVVERGGASARVSLSVLGKYFCTLPAEERSKLARKLLLRVPVVQNYLIMGQKEEILDRDLDVLSAETKKRRGSSVKNMVKWIATTEG